MSQYPIQIPPPGFDDLTVEEKREYVRQLSALIDDDDAPLSLPPQVIAEVLRRRERHRAHPEEAVAWEEVRDRLLAKWG